MTALLSQPASASTAESAIAVDDSFMKTSLFCAGAHGQQYVGEAQQRDYDRRQHRALRHHGVRIPAMHESVDNGENDGDQIQPEMQLDR